MANLYEEALADVRKIKEVAEESAKRAIVEAVVPRIRELIESELMGDDVEDEMKGAPGSPDLQGELITDEDEVMSSETGISVEDILAYSPEDAPVAASKTAMPQIDAITLPDEEGKVTLDIDALVVEPTTGEDFIFGDEIAPTLKKVADVAEPVEIMLTVETLAKSAKNVVRAGKIRTVRESKTYKEQFVNLISQVRNTYNVVQESKLDKNKKKELVEQLRKCSSSLQETMKIMKKINEADVTMKLTGLPDDMDLDAVGVDLVADEAEEETVEGEQDGEEDLGDLDLGEDEGAENTDVKEGRLSDDTVIEIDEGMLRREIKRMRALKEETKPQSWGNGAGDVSDEWTDEGEPLEIVLDEADEDEGEDENLEESDEMDELQDRRKEDEEGSAVADDHHSEVDPYVESYRREKLLQKRINAKITEARTSARAARKANNAKKFNEAKKLFVSLTARLEESVKKTEKLSWRITENKKQQSVASRPTKQADDLRSKLAESNLLNVKLLCTNKILQTSLTEAQKRAVQRRFDEAKSVDEVKALYKRVIKQVSKTDLNEGKVIGSSSQPTRTSGMTVISENVETDRWAKLAGIKTGE
jgi:soluble cytochrome b562